MERADGNADRPDILYGLHSVREAVRAGTRPIRRILVLRLDRQFGDLVQTARAKGIPVHVEPPAVFHRLVPHGKHQGVVAVVAAKAYSTTDEILEQAQMRGEPPLLLLLDGVEDPQNLGAALRTADATGVHGVFIPRLRAVGLTPTVAKASAGALDHVAVCQVVNLIRLIGELKEKGIWIYGVEPRATISYGAVDMSGPVALVFGGEGKGLRPGICKACDRLIHIPMKGHVASLNVSAAVAIILYEVVRQRGSLAHTQVT